MNAKQAKMPTGSMLVAITQAVNIGEEVKLENAALLDTIKAQAAGQIDAKNAADAASTERKGLWSNCLKLAEIVAAAAPSKDTRELVYNIVAADLLESEKANTAKQYAMTARQTLINLHTEQGKEWSDLHELSYGEIRKLIKPDTNPEATQRLAELNKQLKLCIRKGDKAKVLEMLSLVEEVVGEVYRPLKATQDASTQAAKAAKALEDGRQQAPAAPATTETVSGEAQAA